MTRLYQNNNLNYSRLLRPVAHSRGRNRSNGKNYINTYCESKHKELNYRTTHFLVVSKAFFSPYDIKNNEINRHKLVSVLTYFRCTDYIRSEYAVPTKRAISEEL